MVLLKNYFSISIFLVLDMISRSNKISFWVASLILWNVRLETRVKTIIKFIHIANVIN